MWFPFQTRFFLWCLHSIFLLWSVFASLSLWCIGHYHLVFGLVRSLWTPSHGRAKPGRPARTYIQQPCEDTGCSPEDLPEAMNDSEKWRERVWDIRGSSTTWWWWISLYFVSQLLYYWYEVHTIRSQTFFERAFKIVVDSWKFTMLLLYILCDDWPIFMISGWNQQLQQESEYTLLKPGRHSRWISKMQSRREDTLEEICNNILF